MSFKPNGRQQTLRAQVGFKEHMVSSVHANLCAMPYTLSELQEQTLKLLPGHGRAFAGFTAEVQVASIKFEKNVQFKPCDPLLSRITRLHCNDFEEGPNLEGAKTIPFKGLLG